MEVKKETNLCQNQSSSQECNRCDGLGWIFIVDDEGTKRTGKCKCKLDEMKAIKIRKIHPKFKSATFENFRETPVMIHRIDSGEFVSASVPGCINPHGNYYIAGELSTGKTHLIFAQYRHLTEQYMFKTYLAREKELLENLQEQQYHGVCHYDFNKEGLHVFIDEFGATKPTEDRSMHMLEVIDALYSMESGLTITSNLKLSQLEEKEVFGCQTTRITRRIQDMCEIIYFV